MATKTKPPEQLVTCERCGTKNLTPRGLKAHLGTKHCRTAAAQKQAARETLSPRPAAAADRSREQSHPSSAPGKVSKALVLAGAKPLSFEVLDAMPATPQGARGLKEMTLTELETADRGLRALPERLEKMSGICAVLNGLILTEIKGRMTHGKWQPWLKEHWGKTSKTARLYMQISAAFSKNAHSVRFAPEQLTLALLDDTQSGALDLAHPVVAQVEKWADGRSFRQLIEDECGDGRTDNPGGFRPNAQHLRAWLKAEYPDHPEYLESEVFAELPAEVQKRFKAEGERYWERLTKEAKAEIEREEEALDWFSRGPVLLASAMDHGLDDFATVAQLQHLDTLLGDFRLQVKRKLEARAKGAKNPAAKLEARK